MSGTYDNILNRLSRREILLPIFENQMRADSWPQKYTIEIDSSPYYGRGDGYFHPSTHSLMEERQLYYMFHPNTRHLMVQEDFSIEREKTLLVGKSLHAIVQEQMKMTGLVKTEDIEVEYINKDHHIRGRIDFIVTHPMRGRIVVEMKTMTHYKFGKQEDIKPEWDAQLSIALDNMGAENGIILLVETGYPFRMKELPVARNDELLSRIYAKFDRVREAIAMDDTPMACCAPNSTTVSGCPAQFACWKHPEGPQ